jgi:hypothetical protein
MRPLAALALSLCLCAAAHGQVVRPAPNFDLAGTGKSLKDFRGQTVVLLITKSAREKHFREMVYRLKQLYSDFAAERVIFVAAIENGPQEVLSNIPFVVAANPQEVASEYGVNGRYAIAVIGADGNVDLITDRLVAPERVRDMVYNNYESQAASRKPLPGE